MSVPSLLWSVWLQCSWQAKGRSGAPGKQKEGETSHSTFANSPASGRPWTTHCSFPPFPPFSPFPRFPPSRWEVSASSRRSEGSWEDVAATVDRYDMLRPSRVGPCWTQGLQSSDPGWEAEMQEIREASGSARRPPSTAFGIAAFGFSRNMAGGS